MTTTEAQIRDMICDRVNLPPHQLHVDDDLLDIGFDSLDRAALALDIEDQVLAGIELPATVSNSWRTPRDVIDSIKKLLDNPR